MKKTYIVPNMKVCHITMAPLCDIVISQGDPTDDFGSKQRDNAFDNGEKDRWEYGNLW